MRVNEIVFIRVLTFDFSLTRRELIIFFRYVDEQIKAFSFRSHAKRSYTSIHAERYVHGYS